MSEDKNIHRSTSRVLDILELVAEHPSEYNLTDISNLMEAPKSSLYPILYTLTARHFLALDNNGRYKVDFSLYQVGNSYLSQLNFLDEVDKCMYGDFTFWYIERRRCFVFEKNRFSGAYSDDISCRNENSGIRNCNRKSIVNGYGVFGAKKTLSQWFEGINGKYHYGF